MKCFSLNSSNWFTHSTDILRGKFQYNLLLFMTCNHIPVKCASVCRANADKPNRNLPDGSICISVSFAHLLTYSLIDKKHRMDNYKTPMWNGEFFHLGVNDLVSKVFCKTDVLVGDTTIKLLTTCISITSPTWHRHCSSLGPIYIYIYIYIHMCVCVFIISLCRTCSILAQYSKISQT